tara:strand:+ start:666 stop:908 length:243 start_codon:yes stop_codon:yes gene_type:complete
VQEVLDRAVLVQETAGVTEDLAVALALIILLAAGVALEATLAVAVTAGQRMATTPEDLVREELPEVADRQAMDQQEAVVA